MKEDPGKADQSRNRILQASIREFAVHGYAKASTNSIMGEAGMAKGLLFHHFSSKQKLYLACLQNVLAETQEQVDLFLQDMPDDLFERLAAFLKWKQQLAAREPLIFRFLYSIAGLPPSLRAETDSMLNGWRKSNSLLLTDYDQGPWDPAVQQKDALELIVLLFDAIDRKWLQRMEAEPPADQNNQHISRDSTELLNYALRMLEVLKAGFYLNR
ncbi:TetR/AcrR family transcriptional regulator [Spirochaeta dissipatitropha]